MELDTTLDQTWRLVSNGGHLARWLVDVIDVELAVGATGWVEEDGRRRTIRIDEVEAGVRLGFTWWSDDDPTDASRVAIDLEGLETGGSRVRILEQPLFAAHVAGLPAPENDAVRHHRWEVRVLSLWACTVAMALVQ